MRSFSAIILVLAAFVVIAQTSGCYRGGQRPDLSAATRGLQHSPEILADYQPWFGYPGHINVGYSTQNPATLRKQIEKAREMGIYAFAVDWYGERKPFEDGSYALLQQVAAEQHFHVCLMYDETQEDNGHATEDALEAMDKAYRAYIGPQAPARDAYVTYEDRPVIFIFPKRGHTDWDRVREAVNQWEHPPILIYKDQPPPEYARDFDGVYAWIHPSHQWDPSGNDWGKDYLENFYKNNTRTGQITIGAVWPGFNDTKASWTLNRHMARRCGETFEDTLKLFHRYDNPERPMPFMLIATWNDYEEGTQIETGVSDCHKDEARSQVADN